MRLSIACPGFLGVVISGVAMAGPPDLPCSPCQPSELLYTTITTGDFNGDGRWDIVLSAPYFDSESEVTTDVCSESEERLNCAPVMIYLRNGSTEPKPWTYLELTHVGEGDSANRGRTMIPIPTEAEDRSGLAIGWDDDSDPLTGGLVYLLRNDTWFEGPCSLNSSCNAEVILQKEPDSDESPSCDLVSDTDFARVGLALGSYDGTTDSLLLVAGNRLIRGYDLSEESLPAVLEIGYDVGTCGTIHSMTWATLENEGERLVAGLSSGKLLSCEPTYNSERNGDIIPDLFSDVCPDELSVNTEAPISSAVPLTLPIVGVDLSVSGIIAGRSKSSEVEIWRSSSFFSDGFSYPNTGAGSSVLAGDWDGDGLIDYAAGAADSDEVYVELGRGGEPLTFRGVSGTHYGEKMALLPKACTLGIEGPATSSVPGLVVLASGNTSGQPLSILCPTEEIDEDQDGSPLAFDCDDADDMNSPDGSELCDARDNDCDGRIDENAGQEYFEDSDGDGFGGESVGFYCDLPEGAVSNGSDCDDGDVEVNPEAGEVCNGLDDNCTNGVDEGVISTWYLDADFDSYGDPNESVAGCEQPGGHVDNLDDCDDKDMQVYPGSAENCNNSDDDCDGVVDEGLAVVYYPDNDMDGFGLAGDSSVNDCDQPEGSFATLSGDCDDDDASVYPGNIEQFEQCGDGVDQDCSGADLNCDEVDQDFDGYSASEGDCDDDNPNRNPGSEERCTPYSVNEPVGSPYDPIDEDCDGSIDEGVPDSDADGLPDCRDVESCDGLDNDGDGLVDEFYDTDGDGFSDCSLGETSFGCELDPKRYPGQVETCNGVDDDCDGQRDEGFDQDGDGHTTCGLGSGADSGEGPPQHLGVAPDCDDSLATTYPGADEVCDGLDQDCDQLSDEDFDKDGLGAADCSDNDGDGKSEDQGDCDDGDSSVAPHLSETCDGRDENCNGLIDEGFDLDNDCHSTCGLALGSLESGEADSCAGGAGVDCNDSDSSINPMAKESCDGRDQDCDGQTDESDTSSGYDPFDLDEDGTLDCDDFDGDLHYDCLPVQETPEGESSSKPEDMFGSTKCDCDDQNADVYTGASEDGGVNGAGELLPNGQDDDCDGKVDEGTAGYDHDQDGHSVLDEDCDDDDPSQYPGANETWPQGEDGPSGLGSDNDCDEIVDENTEYYDDDGDDQCEAGENCVNTSGSGGSDCNDNDALIYAGAPEYCDEAVDRNCDGLVGVVSNGGDENQCLDADGDGFTLDEGDCDDNDPYVHPGAEEQCGSVDEDCDGVTSEGDGICYSGCGGCAVGSADSGNRGSLFAFFTIFLAFMLRSLQVNRWRAAGQGTSWTAFGVVILIATAPAPLMAAPCNQPLEPYVLEQAVEQAYKHLRAYELTEARTIALQHLDVLECLSEIVPAKTVGMFHLILGLSAWYDELGEAVVKRHFTEALTLYSNLPWDERDDPDLQLIFLDIRRSLVRGPKATLIPGHGFSGSAWLNGEVFDSTVRAYAGRHIIQVEANGRLCTSELNVPMFSGSGDSFKVVLHSQEGACPEVRLSLATPWPRWRTEALITGGLIAATAISTYKLTQQGQDIEDRASGDPFAHCGDGADIEELCQAYRSSRNRSWLLVGLSAAGLATTAWEFRQGSNETAALSVGPGGLALRLSW